MAQAPVEPPVVNSLLIAERVFRDAVTGEWVIAGVFNTLNVAELPAQYPRFEVFFQLTNISRPADLHFRVEHEQGDVVLEFGGDMNAPNPLHVVEQNIVLRGVPFAKAGKYWVQLLSHEEILTQAPLHVKLLEEKHHDDG